VIALKNSKAAIPVAIAADEIDFHELGIRTYEQNRIEQEIAAQQLKARKMVSAWRMS
jgi:hypothetical protein